MLTDFGIVHVTLRTCYASVRIREKHLEIRVYLSLLLQSPLDRSHSRPITALSTLVKLDRDTIKISKKDIRRSLASSRVYDGVLQHTDLSLITTCLVDSYSVVQSSMSATI
jgi:hypothetical protein